MPLKMPESSCDDPVHDAARAIVLLNSLLFAFFVTATATSIRSEDDVGHQVVGVFFLIVGTCFQALPLWHFPPPKPPCTSFTPPYRCSARVGHLQLVYRRLPVRRLSAGLSQQRLPPR